MTDHPSTFSGDTVPSGETAWSDPASIVPVGQGSLLGDSGGSLMRGDFAEMIRMMMRMPDAERQGYAIRKAGDRLYSAADVVALADDPTFPA